MLRNALRLLRPTWIKISPFGRNDRWGCCCATLGGTRCAFPPYIGLFGFADYVGYGVGEVPSIAIGAISEHRHSAVSKVGMLSQ